MSVKFAAPRLGAGFLAAFVVSSTVTLCGCGESHKTGDQVHEAYPEAATANKAMEDFMKNKPAGGPVKQESDMEKFMRKKAR